MALSRSDKKSLNIALFLLLGLFAALFTIAFLFVKDRPYVGESPGQLLADVHVTDPESGDGVMLSSGSAALTSNGSGMVTMSGPYLAVGDDYYGIVSFNYGGSGVFEYVGMWSRDAHDVLEQRGLASLGDRVKVTGISASGDGGRYTVTVDYLDYGPSQSMADIPDTPEQLVIDVVDHQFSTPDTLK